MELLGDVGHGVLFQSVGSQCRCKIGARFARTYHRLRNHFGRTRWYSYVTRLKWMLVSFCLEIVLSLTQDSCTVCGERTIGSEIILDAPDGTPR